MSTNEYLEVFESEVRALLPSVERVWIRAANNRIDLSFRNSKDLISAVAAATGAGIATSIYHALGVNRSRRQTRSCFLVFHLSNLCMDESLTYFLYELIIYKASIGAISKSESELRKV